MHAHVQRYRDARQNVKNACGGALGRYPHCGRNEHHEFKHRPSNCLCWLVLLLLLMSSLLLFEDVASSVCDQKRIQNYGKQILPLIPEAHVMFYFSKSLMNEYEKKYFNGPFPLIVPFDVCHTAITPALDDRSHEWGIKHVQRLKYVLSLLNSWRESMKILLNEAYHLLEFSTSVKYHINQRSGLNQHLQEVLIQLSSQFDYEITTDVEYAPYRGLQNLQSNVELVRLFSFQNFFRCMFYDNRKIVEYLKELLVDVLKYNKC
ncbi:prolactin-like [Octodon degus]|uniref:Prolactin n=1 Tax=Octodon degus TaxID=10160 RepID=A0A6P3FJ84_OCTDE|nr:prolactin-like [Octodon degus]